MALRNPAPVTVLLLGIVLISHLNLASSATGGRSGGGVWPSDGGGGSSGGGSSGWDHHRHDRDDSTTSSEGGALGFIIFAIVLVAFFVFAYFGNCGAQKTSVVKLQVGLMGKARSLQADLNRVSLSADTSTAQGLSYLLTGSTTALLRNLDYSISSYLSVARKHQAGEAQECFNQLSLEERAKFDVETLVNVNNIKFQLPEQSHDEVQKEYIVVTILVATRAAQKLPTIKGTGDLKNALQKIGSISSDKILAVEVLWTPQQENDTLSEMELLKDYPQLRGFYEEGPCKEGKLDEIEQPFLGVKVV